MTLRITMGRDSGGEVVILDGRLDAEGVPELAHVVAGLSGPWRLQLAGLRSADEAGLDALRALRARGIAVTGASTYFRLLLGWDQRREAGDTRSPPRGRRGGRDVRRGRPRA